ncbi:hypothetical protein [Schlesneria paludicola]|uniref:hypothetical protein n=1 Tax=Schlesneria paludicola TaxID=360056 RepID=UPI00029A6716|nr:hypothetical protein [Schlesneria paludicola]
MKRNAFFFGVAYALSIGSVLLLGGRKDGFSMASTSRSSLASDPATAAVANATPETGTAQDLVPDSKSDFATRSQPRFAMVPKRHSLEVLSDATDTRTEHFPSALALNQPSLKSQVDAADIAIAQADPFGVDEGTIVVEPPLNPVPIPAEVAIDELNALAPTELAVEDAAKLVELRETMATLSKTKADLLNARALDDEITLLHKQIANLQAARRLHDAHQVLEKLIQDFPESPAANRAKSMLNALPTSRTPKDRLTPIPDPRFLTPKGA